MNNPKLVAFAGVAKSGKDTAGDYLVDNFGFTRLKFADPVYMIACAVTGLSRSELEQNKEVSSRPDYPTNREILQKAGTEFGRQMIHPNVWLHHMERRYKALLKVLPAAKKRFVITDVRFENEAEWVRTNGGIVIHLLREKAGIGQTHESEQTEVFHNSVVIRNDGSLSALYTQVQKVVNLK